MSAGNTAPRLTEDALRECVFYYLENYEGRGVTEAIICHMFSILYPNIYDAGQYRQENVGIQGAIITPSPFPLIRLHMNQARSDLIYVLEGTMDEGEREEAIVRYFHRFNAIHPFRDGNGRVSRAVLHLLLRQQGILTAQNEFYDLFAYRRDEYLEAMKEADEGEFWHLRALVAIGILDTYWKDTFDQITALGIEGEIPEDMRYLLEGSQRHALRIDHYIDETSRLRKTAHALVMREYKVLLPGE